MASRRFTVTAGCWIRPVAGDAQRRIVEGIRNETQALGEVVTRFLNFAKPEPLALAPVDLRALVERAAEDTPGARRDRSLASSATIEGDEVLLRQAFSNLFRNSVEACTLRAGRRASSIEGRIDRAARLVHVDGARQRPGNPAEAMPRRLPAVLHDPTGRNRPRSRDRAEGRRQPQRPRSPRQIARRAVRVLTMTLPRARRGTGTES